MKDDRSQRGEGFVQCEQGGMGVFRCGRPHFLVQKSSVFFSKFMVCPHGQRGLSQCGQGRGCQFFAILYGRLLWTAPYMMIWPNPLPHVSVWAIPLEALYNIWTFPKSNTMVLVIDIIMEQGIINVIHFNNISAKLLLVRRETKNCDVEEISGRL